MSYKDEEQKEGNGSKDGPNKEEQKGNNADQGLDPQLMKRIKASRKLVYEVKKLFAFLAQSDKKYADPTGVLQAIVDDFGNPIQIGEQKDIGEFNNTFLARVVEGLNGD